MKSPDLFISRVYKGTCLSLLFLLVSFYSYSQCNCPPVATCGACVGGMTRLTFKFNDSRILPILPATVTVSDGGGLIFSGALSDGETFEVTANVEGNLFIGNQITIGILLGASVNVST